ncbi:MAG: c-type cytochrome [Myxococcota bacterium]|nr:c-type cytochrome [Myxococcota bacterium]
MSGSTLVRRLRMLGLTCLGVVGVATVVLYAGVYAHVLAPREVEPDPLFVPVGDAAAIERGRHLAEVVTSCTQCHGADYSGLEMADDFPLGRLWASNLTPGRGGIADRSDADLVRSIRHGVKPDGRPVLMMPSQYLYHLTDEDLGALIAFLRSLPPVDREHPGLRLGPVTVLAIATGQVPDLIPANVLAENPARMEPPEVAATTAYGGYLVETSGCKVCHHDNLSGGRHPLALPEEPTPPDLRSGSRLARWSEDDFLRALRSGVTPEGDQMDPRWMPWPAIGQMSDTELRAIYRYLRTLPHA